MTIIIKETNERKDLSVYIPSAPGIDQTADFIEAANYETDEDGNMIMTADDYEWWSDVIREHDDFFAFCEDNDLDAAEIIFKSDANSDDMYTYYARAMAEAKEAVEVRG